MLNSVGVSSLMDKSRWTLRIERPFSCMLDKLLHSHYVCVLQELNNFDLWSVVS